MVVMALEASVAVVEEVPVVMVLVEASPEEAQAVDSQVAVVPVVVSEAEAPSKKSLTKLVAILLLWFLQGE